MDTYEVEMVVNGEFTIKVQVETEMRSLALGRATSLLAGILKPGVRLECTGTVMKV